MTPERLRICSATRKPSSKSMACSSLTKRTLLATRAEVSHSNGSSRTFTGGRSKHNTALSCFPQRWETRARVQQWVDPAAAGVLYESDWRGPRRLHAIYTDVDWGARRRFPSGRGGFDHALSMTFGAGFASGWPKVLTSTAFRSWNLSGHSRVACLPAVVGARAARFDDRLLSNGRAIGPRCVSRRPGSAHNLDTARGAADGASDRRVASQRPRPARGVAEFLNRLTMLIHLCQSSNAASPTTTPRLRVQAWSPSRKS